MRIIKTVKQMQAFCEQARRRGKKIGLVPTMGYLHEGHLSLMRQARKETDLVIISIFVNPTQFGPDEDFKKYPRDLKKDERLARSVGVDVIFYPTAKQMYPDGFLTSVSVDKLTSGLCGAHRPGHFRGVMTVCAKLFNIIKPHVAYFGQKDAQQAAAIKKMVEDLDMNFKVRVMPIVREPDGLAMSSRNAYLNPSERKNALCLYNALQTAQDMVKSGCLDVKQIKAKITKIVRARKGTKIGYVSFVDPNTLQDVKRIKGKILLAMAVSVGKTRLIDNIVLKGG